MSIVDSDTAESVMSDVGQIERVPARVEADCRIDRRTFPVTVSSLGSDGCVIESAGDELEPSEFLNLRIGGAMDVNGCTVWCDGRKAQVRFFGQVHPVAIDCLCRGKGASN